MVYQSESEMYPHLVTWLKAFLKQRHRDAEVYAFDTHNVYLSAFLPGKGFSSGGAFPAYEIKVDVTGVIREDSVDRLAFVEAKLNPIRLIDVAQIIGYSRVAEPQYAFILSPQGANDAVTRLFQTFHKLRVLKYNEDRSVVVARWDEARKDIDYMTLIPQGAV